MIPPTPRHVLMTSDAVGGVWSYALELAQGFGEAGIETTLAVLGPAPGSAQQRAAASVPGLTVIETGLPLDWTAVDEAALQRAAREIAELAERSRPDIVHLNAPALAAGAPFPAPLVAVAHSCVATWWRAVRTGPLPPDFAWRARRMAQGMAAAQVVIAPSHSFAAALREVYGADLRFHVVHNGLRPVQAQPTVKKNIVLTTGRLWDDGKNVAVLDRAAGRLGVPVFAAGPLSGPNGAAIRLEHIRALGMLDPGALARWYGDAAIFVSLARYEPFGLAPLEAAQAGAALVLSDIPTFRELWDGAASFVDPDDADALAAALQTALDRPEALRLAGAEARKRARRYSAAKMVRGTLQAYGAAAGGSFRSAA